MRAVGEGPVALGVLGRVGDGVVQRLVHEGHVTPLLRHVGQGGGHVAADRVSGDGQAGGVEPFAGTLGGDPAGGGVGLLDGDGVSGLRRAVVLHEDQRCVHPDRQLAHEPVVRAGVAEDPATAVHVEDHGQRADAADGLDDAHPHVAHLRRNGEPLVVHVRLFDGLRLHVVEQLARALDPELVQQRRLGRRVGEILRGGFENNVAHGVVPLCW